MSKNCLEEPQGKGEASPFLNTRPFDEAKWDASPLHAIFLDYVGLCF
jgi:hypothetical protein